MSAFNSIKDLQAFSRQMIHRPVYKTFNSIKDLLRNLSRDLSQRNDSAFNSIKDLRIPPETIEKIRDIMLSIL